MGLVASFLLVEHHCKSNELNGDVAYASNMNDMGWLVGEL